MGWHGIWVYDHVYMPVCWFKNMNYLDSSVARERKKVYTRDQENISVVSTEMKVTSKDWLVFKNSTFTCGIWFKLQLEQWLLSAYF